MTTRKFTQAAADEVLRASPDMPWLEFLEVAKEHRPSWYKAEQRFFEETAKKFQAARAKLEPVSAPVIGGVREGPEARREVAHGKTFVFTMAQNNTHLHDEWWDSLRLYCKLRNAELHVARVMYNKNALGATSAKTGSRKKSDGDEVWYDPRIAEFVSDVPMQVAKGLVWCGEMNISPTAVDPLSNMDTFARGASIIVPHTKQRMKSVPTMKHDPVKFQYTTGACTLRNYIQRKAGQIADYHHIFGAVVVEVDAAGEWWIRQLNASEDGTFYDMTTYYTPTGFHAGVCAEGITHGDLHGDKLDPNVERIVWGKGGVVDKLMPMHQFFHDTVDFGPRNHHNISDPHFLHKVHVHGADNVGMEFDAIAKKLAKGFYRRYSESVVVVSNHDQAILHWLKNPSAQFDPVNAQLWHELNSHVLSEQTAGGEPHPFSYLLNSSYDKYRADGQPKLTIVQEDHSFKLLDEIECGMHGHLGPNGARGNPRNLRTVGKSNTGHTHSAGILDGVFTAGVYATLDLGYNRGLSSWSHSFVITYPNAKRTICTIKKGRAWR